MDGPFSVTREMRSRSTVWLRDDSALHLVLPTARRCDDDHRGGGRGVRMRAVYNTECHELGEVGTQQRGRFFCETQPRQHAGASAALGSWGGGLALAAASKTSKSLGWHQIMQSDRWG